MKFIDKKRLNRLKVIYAIALAFIALTLLSSSLLMQYTIHQNTDISRVINLSGRQRMLSQRLTKCVLALERRGSAEERELRFKEMRESFTAWKEAQLGLQRGDEALGLEVRENSPEIRALFAEMEPFYNVMVKEIEGLLSMGVAERLDPAMVKVTAEAILRNELSFLGLMDKTTFQFDKEARERISSMQRLETLFLVVGLLVLTFEFFFVFRPSISQLSEALVSLRENGEQLERRNDELEAVISRIKRLEGIIPICMYCKKIRDDGSSWQQMEQYITEHSEALFSHGICPDCYDEKMSALKSK